MIFDAHSAADWHRRGTLARVMANDAQAGLASKLFGRAWDDVTGDNFSKRHRRDVRRSIKGSSSTEAREKFP